MEKEQGQAFIEYLILIAVIAVMCVPAIQTLAEAIHHSSVEAAKEIANQ